MPCLPEQNTQSFRLTVLYFTPNKFVTAPLSPTCHPERSGTTHQKSHAPTKHCRTANPAPSGAPAGGISVVKRHHITTLTTKKAFPFEEKGYCGGMVA